MMSVFTDTARLCGTKHITIATGDWPSKTSVPHIDIVRPWRSSAQLNDTDQWDGMVLLKQTFSLSASHTIMYVSFV